MNYAIGHYQEAKSLVERYHYSHRWPGAVLVVGTLHNHGGLFGDLGEAVAACVFGISATKWRVDLLELQRLVRVDSCKIPLTGLISFTVKFIKRQGISDLLISYADNDENHHGGIYQAASWNFAGLRKPQTLGVIVDGVKIHGRTLNHTSGKYALGTRSVSQLREKYPNRDFRPWTDSGKYLYWKSLTNTGKRKAKLVGLESLPYIKPSDKAVT